MFLRLCASPIYRFIAITTVLPRVVFGNNAYFMPLLRMPFSVRLSMLAGELSKTSPCAIAALGLKVFNSATTSALAGAGARSGLASGIKLPVVRLLVLNHVVATRCTSATVSALTRSRNNNIKRQSPEAILSDSATANLSGSLKTCAKSEFNFALARANSSSVTGCCAKPSIVLTMIFLASAVS